MKRNYDTFLLPMTALGGRPRNIRVLFPVGGAGRRFPVLYMPDGQNLFFDREATYGTCWGFPATLEKLGLDLIVVGFDSANDLKRLDELSPWKNDWIRTRTTTIDREVGGEGEATAEFVAGQLKPHIDRNYPTLPDRDNTFAAGSSMGGLFSLYLLGRYPQLFSRAACFSSAFWFAKDPLTAYLSQVDVSLWHKVYLDVGTQEGSRVRDEEERLGYIRDTQNVHDQLAARGLGPDRLKAVFEEGGEHNEAAWARRLPDALRWFLSTK